MEGWEEEEQLEQEEGEEEKEEEEENEEGLVAVVGIRGPIEAYDCLIVISSEIHQRKEMGYVPTDQ